MFINCVVVYFDLSNVVIKSLYHVIYRFYQYTCRRITLSLHRTQAKYALLQRVYILHLFTVFMNLYLYKIPMFICLINCRGPPVPFVMTLTMSTWIFETDTRFDLTEGQHCLVRARRNKNHSYKTLLSLYLTRGETFSIFLPLSRL